MKNTIISFFVSSFVSLLTIFYLGYYYRKSSSIKSGIDIEYFPIGISITYGLFGMINYRMIQMYGINISYVIGGIMGLLLSIIGRFIYKLPVKIFGFTNKNDYSVHFIAVVMYALIFRYIITPLTIYVLN